MQKRVDVIAAVSVAVVAVVAVGAIAWHGRGDAPAVDSGTSTVAEVASTSSPRPTPTDPAGPPPAAGTLVASTDLASADGRASIHLDVVATGNDDYVVQTSDYRSELGIPLAIFFRQFDEQVGDTISDGVSFGYDAWGEQGETAQVPDQQFRLQEAGDDPSFLKNVVLTDRPDTGTWKILGVAALHWSAPDRHPDLHVVDHGARGHARGTVDSEDGVPRWYHVAQGDTAWSVARRFGVDVDDLDYLSARQAPELRGVLTSGTLLNLDRTKR
jgi:hypothetical protein